MRVYRFVLGQLQTNCYFLIDQSDNALIIDPADSGEFLSEKIIQLKLKPEAILLTHGHFDHILACFELQQNFDLKIYSHTADKFLIERAAESAEYFLGKTVVFIPPKIEYFNTQPKFNSTFNFKTFHTPGHTPGSCSYYFPQEKLLFSGDVVFKNAVGRWDFSYSNKKLLYQSLIKLNRLDPNTVIYPGHGETATVSNIPYLLSAFFKRV
ncbi:MAG: hypothetical protein KatS3mg091_580 [Patescibacteria group bacterium]|nr:MAG: hypothetical protein KatS3mg091_580 [Patescibacteria group bacterium]